MDSYENENVMATFTTLVDADCPPLEPSLLRHSDALPDGEEIVVTKSSRYPADATRVLNAWVQAHWNHPYPTSDEKRELKLCTGLSIRQISNWLANVRRRKIKPKPVPIKGWEDMTPLDRWRSSPPEAEPAPISAIADACARDAMSLPMSSSLRSDGTDAAFSVFSFAANTSTGSESSNSSAQSTYSFNRFHSCVPRRCRRQRKPINLDKEADDRPYQCTFCTDVFKTKYDWARYEKSLHLSLEKWVCAPFGETCLNEDGSNIQCVFCGATSPSSSHGATHRYLECADKPSSARTFYRKDHMLQHLRLVHGVSEMLPTMRGWNSAIDRVNSRCGFCTDVRFTSWKARNEHLASHFRAGAKMKDWRGCRGLDPAIAMMVENAMPPYLIGSEANELVPFSASRLAAGGREGTEQCQNENADEQPRKCVENGKTAPAPTPFEMLTARLGHFVHTCRQAGTPVTDESLQREARRLMYDGDEDPWNQTAADNVQWLRMFKAGHGLLDNDDPLLAGMLADQLRHVQDTETQLFLMSMCHGEETMPFITADILDDGVRDDAGEGLWEATMEGCGFGSGDCTSFPHGPRASAIPWALQSPECLVEYLACSRKVGLDAQSAAGHCPP